MKLGLATITLGLTAAVTAQFENQSKPFHLVLQSSDKSINGDTISACHTGAAIESLCLSNSNSTSKPEPIAATPFQFNTSDNAAATDPGVLTFELQGSNFNISEGLQIQALASSDVAFLLFSPGTNDQFEVAFDSKDLLSVQGYIDDTQNPPVGGAVTSYYRWYACKTYYSGYQYVTLNWVLGKQTPQNPSCIKTDVKRVYV